ncbi:MAG: type II toxin-antitoxin system RelE/ParE family toxin [Deltaproteobacteria bacterium]|nr:type II toxin-antitoxin system RelE/ParE family toxin [Deltaproteobacteria bacterium]
MTRPRGGRRKVAVSIEWTERAVADLRAIDDYIAAHDPAAAKRWVGRLIAKAEAAARLPMAGRVVPEKGRSDIREVLLRTYRLVYRVREDGILVLTVFEGHRLFPPGAAEADDE